MSARSNECVLSLDISLDDLDTTILSPYGDWTPHQTYSNNWPGFQALKRDLLAYLGNLENARLTVAGESTGILHSSLSQQSRFCSFREGARMSVKRERSEKESYE